MPEAPPQTQFSSSAPVTVAEQGPKGVGGWLLLYCVSLAILAPASVLLFILTLRFRVSSLYQPLDMVRFIYGMVVGILLWARRPISLLLLRIYFGVVGVSFLIYTLDITSFALRSHTALALATRIRSLMISAGITLLWFVYFLRSKRVRNTYGRNL